CGPIVRRSSAGAGRRSVSCVYLRGQTRLRRQSGRSRKPPAPWDRSGRPAGEAMPPKRKRGLGELVHALLNTEEFRAAKTGDVARSEPFTHLRKGGENAFGIEG